MDFGEAFVILFKRSGMSQADFARKGGFSTAYVAQLANAKVRNPTFKRACEIADALGVTTNDFRILMEGDRTG